MKLSSLGERMRKLFSLVLMILTLFSFRVLAKENELLFLTGEHPPFSSSTMPQKGLATEIVMSICADAKLTCKIEFLPWLRCEYLVETGKAFAAFPYGYTKERGKKFLYSDSLYFLIDTHLFFKSNNFKFPSKISFQEIKNAGIRVGTLRGNLYVTDFIKHGIKYEESNDHNSLILKLINNRIDAIVEVKQVLRYEMKKFEKTDTQSIKSSEITDYPVSSPSMLIVSKKYENSQNLLKKINYSLNKLRNNGVIDKIISNYN